eukprot:scaffold10260_cov266-Chaetoceros_neogracile.AAC.68
MFLCTKVAAAALFLLVTSSICDAKNESTTSQSSSADGINDNKRRMNEQGIVSGSKASTRVSCTNSPPGWSDSGGPNYDCAYYAANSNCAKFGDMYENSGATANQACCVCGGGEDGSNSSPTSGPVAKPLTSSPTSTPVSCTDSPPGWSDSTGPNFDCIYYALNNNCEKYGDMYENSGATAYQACCVCGGGEDASNSSPTSSPVAIPLTLSPTSTPVSCTDSPSGWSDSTGPNFDCEYYAVNNNCAKFGDMYENSGATANQACCVCGGGEDASNSSPTSSPVAIPLTSSPTSTPVSCTDSPPGWSDSTGPNFDCEYYALNNNCAKFGDMYENSGATANQACCVCGGGEDGSNSSPTSSPVAKPFTSGPTSTPVSCTDSPPGWSDSTGPNYDCEYYEYYALNNNCAKFGDMYENNGATANQACCVCGGGEDASNPSTVSTPTSSPVANPTGSTSSAILEMQILLGPVSWGFLLVGCVLLY